MQYLVFLITFFLAACSGSGGTGSTGNQTIAPVGYVGHTEFDETNITMKVGETREVTMYLKNYALNDKPEPAPFNPIFEGSNNNIVVTLNPEICTLDYSETPPSCKTRITAVKTGKVEIYGPQYGGRFGHELLITVLDNN